MVKGLCRHWGPETTSNDCLWRGTKRGGKLLELFHIEIGCCPVRNVVIIPSNDIVAINHTPRWGGAGGSLRNRSDTDQMLPPLIEQARHRYPLDHIDSASDQLKVLTAQIHNAGRLGDAAVKPRLDRMSVGGQNVARLRRHERANVT